MYFKIWRNLNLLIWWYTSQWIKWILPAWNIFWWEVYKLTIRNHSYRSLAVVFVFQPDATCAADSCSVHHSRFLLSLTACLHCLCPHIPSECVPVVGNTLCGFIRCSAVRRHLGCVSSVGSVLLEALDQVAVPDLWYQSPATTAAATVCAVALLLSSSILYSVTTAQLALTFTLCVCMFPCAALLFLSLMCTQQQQTAKQYRLCYEWHPLAHPEEVYAPMWLYKLSPLS